MKDISTYLSESLNEINEATWVGPALRYAGTILLSTVIPYLISLGIKIATLKIDTWVQKFIKKYPGYKDAIVLIGQVLKDDLDKCLKSRELIYNSEHQKPSSYYKLSEYEEEILNCIQSDDDKKKVRELFKLIETDSFKEEIDECVKLNIKSMINEGLNININDIEDDDLRKKVIKYFKTFKKGKLEDEDLADNSDDEEKNDEKEKSDEELDPELQKQYDDAIEFFKKEGSKDPEKDLEDYLKTVYGDPNDSDFKEMAAEEMDEGGSTNIANINEASTLARILTGSYITSGVYAKLAKDRMAVLQCKMEQEKSESKKKEMEQAIDMIRKSNFDEKGRPKTRLFGGIKDTVTGIKSLDKGAGIGDVLKNCTLVGRVAGFAETKKFKKENPDKFERALDDVKDLISDKTEKDEDGNVLKQEEITDKDGKKKKVTTHTGPRGGKFYWPDGVPKDAKHKVYIDRSGKVKECMDLMDYLYEKF